MQTSDFHFHLPPELIAQQPPRQRGDSRLLVLDRDGVPRDRHFSHLPELLRPGDLLIFNDTRVIPARLFGRKASGGKVELLLERLLDEHRVLAHVRASRSPRTDTWLELDGGIKAQVLGRREDLFELRFDDPRPVLEILEVHGHVPLPPYIQRPDAHEDRERYQTVYSRRPGAVAAPTAGLHFTDDLLTRLEAQGVERGFVTLHVGAGTFLPVRVERPEAHRMHAEWLEVNDTVCDQIRATRRRGGRVVAVGTTAVRALESAAGPDGDTQPFRGDTRIFIYPGYRFRCVDVLITNFHLPESTLLMLVSAFAGFEPVMNAYRHAVAQGYRFFSYGDAMLLSRAGEG